MALTGISDDFELDDHGILRDSFASDFHVDDDGILHDDLDLFKHAVNTAGHGTDSGIGGDKRSSTSTLQHLHASFDEDIAPIGDESINISDFEASRDELDSFDGDQNGGRRSRSFRGAKDLDTPGSTLERPDDYRSTPSKKLKKNRSGYGERENQDLFSADYYQQLRDLGVLVDGADFSRDESQTEFEALETHLSRENVYYDDDNRDLIGEYLQDEYDRERAEEEGEETEGKDERNHSHAYPSSRANSAPTISEHSFPEISPEDAEMMYSESQQAGDDDEVYLINNQLMPASSRIQAQKLPQTPSEPASRPDSRGSQPRTPYNPERRTRSRQTPSPTVSFKEDLHEDFQKSRSQTHNHQKGRPNSAASRVLAASERGHPHPSSAMPVKSAMSKAHSQESFFEQDKEQNRSTEKVPKRMLPTPGTPDSHQSFRVKSKSKSVSNIARSEPMKPTHMPLSEMTNAVTDESIDGGSGVGSTSADRSVDRSEGELSSQLKQESSKRQQATELVQQLQKEYDSLLSKYALAELTIDQMRLGARITLHADSPTPHSVQSGAIVQGAGAHKPQMMQLPIPSAQRAVVGHFNAHPGDGRSLATTQAQTSDVQSRSASRADMPQEDVSFGDAPDSEECVSSKTPRTGESVTLSIQTQAAALNDRMDQFHTLLENRQLTIEEQEKAFENIRTDHEKLRRSYLQAKEDYNVLKRSGASSDADFDQDKELEGQLFRLGMKFDEVHERVDSNLKEQAAQRQPFQTSRLAENEDEDNIDGEDQTTEEDGQHGGQSGGAAGGTENANIEKRADQLHEEYRALMDRYRRLKQMAPTPELEKEKDNLVRKLNEICTEMPDAFHLAPELQDRWERLHRRDQRRSPLPQGGAGEDGVVGGLNPGHHHNRLPSVPPSPGIRGVPLVGDHSISPYMGGHQGNRETHIDDSFRRTPNSANNSHSNMASPVGNTSAAASAYNRDRQASPSSIDGAVGPHDRDQYDARINRPRRHQHDFHDPKLSKMADVRGSYSSLPDSGISDQDGRDPPHHDDRLAHLPGPGKMKQMTRQRGDTDMDSGFMGSVVSTDGAQRRPESPLRLRNRQAAERNQNRSRMDSGGSSTADNMQQHRDAGRQPHPAKSTAPVPALVGLRHDSVDRSYDGELDESTLSDAHVQPSGSRDVRPKTSSHPNSGRRRDNRKREGASTQSQSLRSTKSHSVQGDGTLEDVSDGEMSEASTPRNVESAQSAHNRSSSSQQAKSLPASARPPTPHQPPTPKRPPTPYHVEQEEAHPETVPPESERMRLRRPSDDEVVQRRMQQQRSRLSVPQARPRDQRALSHGAPTTDLYNTHSRPTDRDDQTSARSSRPGSRYGHRSDQAAGNTKAEGRGVGSDVEVRSDATRDSSINSARLRAMQDEIEKLKEGLKQTHEKVSERPKPSPASEAPQHEGPEYYDPFDDPYGFMRVPRRRANSFSGGRVREFDEWYWNLPNERRNEDADIPLGYAAADAYNRRHRDKTPEGARQRLRHHGDRRRQSEGTYPKSVVEADGGQPIATAPPSLGTVTLPARPPAQIRRPPISDPQAMYNYYVPSRLGGQEPYQIASANPYRQHTTPLSSSQPNLAATLSGVEPSNPYQNNQKRPWYTIRRSQWPVSGQYFPTTGTRPRKPPVTFAAQPVQQNVDYYSSGYSPMPSEAPVQGSVGYKMEACPLCGGSGAHIHEEDVEPVHGYMAQDFATNPGHERQSRPRQRSRSASRSRHYTPERSSSHSRYLVREFGDLSFSEDSDHGPSTKPRRSRSLSRSRGHSETRSSSTHSSSRRRGRRYHRDVDMYDSDEDVDLNESLVLSNDINRLTKRMIGTVRGELKRHKDKKEFGSSYW